MEYMNDDKDNALIKEETNPIEYTYQLRIEPNKKKKDIKIFIFKIIFTMLIFGLCVFIIISVNGIKN